MNNKINKLKKVNNQSIVAPFSVSYCSVNELVDFIYVDKNKIKMEGKYIRLKSEREDDKLFFEEGYLEFNIDNIEKADYKEFWSNRQIKVQGQYKSGQKYGKWLYFNTDGVLLKEVGYMKDIFDKYFEYYSIQH